MSREAGLLPSSFHVPQTDLVFVEVEAMTVRREGRRQDPSGGHRIAAHRVFGSPYRQSRIDRHDVRRRRSGRRATGGAACVLIFAALSSFRISMSQECVQSTLADIRPGARWRKGGRWSRPNEEATEPSRYFFIPGRSFLCPGSYLWDLENDKEPLRRFSGHSWVVTSVVFFGP